MSESARKMTREEFYRRIWSTPIVKLGKELGFSYLEMVRLCSALNVPRPSGGYWWRVAHGGPIEQVPLPTAESGVPLEIELKAQEQAAQATGPEVSLTKPENPERPPTAAAAIEETSAQSVLGAKIESTPNTPSKSTIPERVTYTRGELYEAIWSIPCHTLAANLGISDVGLAKQCRRLGIPRPTRGYWAKLAAGQSPTKRKLPPAAAEQNRVVTFDVNKNSLRRKELADARGLEDLAVELELPDAAVPLHPLADRHKLALEKLEAGSDGFVRLQRKDCFRCVITPSSINRTTLALHALVTELEARSYKFRRSNEEYGNLDILHGDYSATIHITEIQEQVQRELSDADKRRPSWTWQLKETRATGRLSIEVHALGLKGRRGWNETTDRPLDQVLGIVVEKVHAVFSALEDRERQRAEDAKRREEQLKRWEEERAQEEKRRLEAERLKNHEAKLAAILRKRRKNLELGARRWVEGQHVASFLQECEARWRKTSGGDLSAQQAKWLDWARAEAAKIDPFGQGYPDPDTDGPFEAKDVPLNGPYPPMRVLAEQSPDEIKQPPEEQRSPLAQPSWGWKY